MVISRGFRISGRPKKSKKTRNYDFSKIDALKKALSVHLKGITEEINYVYFQGRNQFDIINFIKNIYLIF